MQLMERGGGGRCPYFDPDYESLIERINPPRVCVDNDACEDCTFVKVDSANRHGILLEMVQVLTDLDLVISKSYVSSDGQWLMNVFHITDQLGNKVTDPNLILYIQQSLIRGRTQRIPSLSPVITCLGKSPGIRPLSADYTSLEMLARDCPGLLAQISAVLAEAGCHVASAEAWSHSSHVAMLLYLSDYSTGKPISNESCLVDIHQRVENVLRSFHDVDKMWKLRVAGPQQWVHTERRLHQLLHEVRDCEGISSIESKIAGGEEIETHVSIDICKEKGYSVVNIRSRDRPKLLFDTVCALTDMNYVVFHATVSSHGPLAVQEYYIRKMDGCALESEDERCQVARCILAAIERRPSHGLAFSVSTSNRTGLLSDITRVFGEHGLTLTRAKIGTRNETAIGTFFLTDALGREVSADILEPVKKVVGGSVTLNRPIIRPREEIKVSTDPAARSAPAGSCSTNSNGHHNHVVVEQRGKLSLGSFSWSGMIELFSHNFGSIRS